MAPAGAVLTVLLLLYDDFGPHVDGGVWFSLSFLCAVFYGLLSGDFKLSALFGFLFFSTFPFAILLHYHEAPPPSAVPYLLMYGLGFALLGVISALIGRRLPLE